MTAALVAAMVVTGCSDDAGPPVIDATPIDAADAAPIDAADAAPIDAADASPIDAMPPLLCEPGAPAYDGPLCGPPERPCRVLADSVLPSPPTAFNDAPAVAVDEQCLPQVTFATDRREGRHAHMGTDGRWNVVGTPFPISSVSAAVTPEGSPVLLVYGGAFDVSLWTLGDTAGEWTDVPMPGQALSSAAAMQRGSDGVIHAALSSSSNTLQYARLADGLDGTWEVTSLAETVQASPALALSPDDVPHLTWWHPETGGASLRWSQGPGAIETVMSLGGPLGINARWQSLAVGPADAANPGGRPHVLFARYRQDMGIHEVYYATREGADTWTNTLVDDEHVPDESRCNYDPTAEGQTCESRYGTVWPIGVVVGRAGDARLLYIKQFNDRSLMSVCDGPVLGGDPPCHWHTVTDRSSIALHVAWPDETGAVLRAAVADVAEANAGTVTLDRLGTVHIALYSYELPSYTLQTRYLRIGP